MAEKFNTLVWERGGTLPESGEPVRCLCELRKGEAG
jgi:hypothetical protein